MMAVLHISVDVMRLRPQQILVMCLALCCVTCTIGGSVYVHETGEAKSSSYSQSGEASHASHSSYARVSGAGHIGVQDLIPVGHASGSASERSVSGMGASKTGHQAGQARVQADAARTDSHSSHDASSQSSSRTSETSSRTANNSATASDRQSASRRMSELDRVSAMSANPEQRNYFRELFERRCKDCVVNGENYRGHSRFEYDEGCSRYRCICSCDGSYNCPAQYTIDICKDGQTTKESSSAEPRQADRQRRRCQRCEAYGQEFEGNAYFDVQDGCIKHRGCICYCNGTWSCPQEREINTCEEELAAAEAKCSACTAKGKVVEGNSYFELEEPCKRYRYCRCRCDGSWQCPDEYVEDTCKSLTTQAPVQDSSCQRCYANGKEVQGNTYFELTDGCIEYKNCVCRCNGSWTCPPQYARNTCLEEGGTARNQSAVAVNTAECQSCSAYEKYFRGNTYFTIRNGCTRYSNCVCRCDGSWDCPHRYATNVCDDDGNSDDNDDPCSFCDARGKVIPSNSFFNFTEDCIRYSQCLCHCDGAWSCPEHHATNICDMAAGGTVVPAERECGTCMVDSRVVRGNTRFSRVSVCYRYRDCLCKCDGTYECPADRAENICQMNTAASSSSATTSAPCRRCFAFGQLHAPSSRFSHEDGCVEYGCDCHCNGSYTCPPERTRDICQAGCTQCELEGMVYDGNSYFRRRQGCVEYTCTCFCNGSWDCPADNADRSGCAAASVTASRDSGAIASDVSRPGRCTQCLARDGQTHAPESNFVLTDGCIHYQCRCNCDGSWECPGETARNVCRGEELGGCRSCVISETQIYRGDDNFVMRDGCIHYSCRCNCDGSWECPGEEARDICLGEVPGGCRLCRVSENETYRANSQFQLRQGCVHYQCNCHCNGSWECPGNTARDVCVGEIPGGCRVCKLEGGEVYLGESDFQMERNCVHYKCRCNCDGSWNCPGETARRVCNADGTPQRESSCRTCVVSDTEQFQGDQAFTLRRGCNEFQCQCECDGSWNCPADRTRNVCGTRPDPALTAQTCRVCRVSAYTYPGSSAFLLTRGCKQYACRCDCNGRWSCNHTVARDICQDQNTAFGTSSVSSTSIQTRAQNTIASTATQAAVSTARGRSVAETRIDSMSAVTRPGCRPCMVDNVERAPETEFVLTKPCRQFTCFCGCNGRWRCPRNQTVDLCPDGDRTRTDASATSSRTSTSATDSRQAALDHQKRLEADRRRYSTDYRKRYSTDARTRGSGTAVYTQPGSGGGQRYGTTNIRVVGAADAADADSPSSSSSSSYYSRAQAGSQDGQGYGQYNVRGYYLDTGSQAGQQYEQQGYQAYPQGQGTYTQGQGQIMYTQGQGAHGQVPASGGGYADSRQTSYSHTSYLQGNGYPAAASDADSFVEEGEDETGGGTCTPCQVDEKVYQTGAKFDWRRGCVVYKCTCLCSGSYRCRLSLDSGCDQEQSAAGPGGLPVAPAGGHTASQPGGACGNCYVQGYVFPGNMSFTLRQGCEELSCRCGCNGAHECQDRTPIPGCTAMSTPLAGAVYPYGSSSAVYPLGGGGYAVRPGRVYNTFQHQSFYNTGGIVPGGGVLVPILVSGQMPPQIPVMKPQQPPAAQPQAQAASQQSRSHTSVQLVPMRQVPDSDSAQGASMEDSNCATCFANGRSYRGSFDYTKDCYHLTCYCDCEGRLICSAQPDNSAACPAQYGPISGQCRSCVVQGHEYPPSVEFALRIGCYGYDCTCGCDGMWMCPNQTPTNYCVQPANPPHGAGDDAYNVQSAVRRTAELRDRTYSRTAELTEGTGSACVDCDVRGTAYPSRNKFFLRDGCVQHTCDCACDGSWSCPKSANVDICQEGQRQEKQAKLKEQEMQDKHKQEMRHKREDESMTQQERALAEVAAYQARLSAQQGECRSCQVQDKTYLTKADFQYRRDCYLYSCHCYCNGTFECPMDKVKNMCAAGDYQQDGCRECHMANKTYPGGQPFTYTEGCWEFSCLCGCNGHADCPPEQSRDLCQAGSSPAQLLGRVDAAGAVEEGGAGSARCKPCVVDGQVIRPKGDFSHRRGCTEFLCQCACDGTWECPQDRSHNFCGQDPASDNPTSVSDLTAPPTKGCTVGRRTYFTRLFAFYDQCMQYMCICYNSGAWRCPRGKERRVC